MELKVKLYEGAKMPTRAHAADAGLDLYAPTAFAVPAANDYGCGTAVIDTGVCIEIPEGYVGMIKSKSGLNVRSDLTAEGVIDSGYTGSMAVKLYNHGPFARRFAAGDKIAQLVILPCALPDLLQVDDLADTDRGTGGFGSTGR